MKQLIRNHQNTSSSSNCIDTPANMNRSSIKQACNYLIANKVELVDLNGNTNEITLNHNFNNNSIINNHRQRSFSPLSTSSSSSSTDVLCQQQQQTPTNTLPLPKNSNKYNNNSDFETKELFINPKLKSSLFLLNSIPNLTSIMNKSSTSSSASHSPVAQSQSKSTTNNNYQLVDPNKIHLFVKAGQDGRSQGACPFCQDVFLQLLIKAQTNKFNFDVITINMDNPPKEFKELSIKPPVLIHGSSNLAGSDSSSVYNENVNAVILSDVDEIAEYLDRLYPNSKLVVHNSEAKRVCLNVFSKFSFFIRDVSSKSTYLEAELEKIDAYLRENTNEDNKFLNGNSMTALDCSLLPKLQHIRVAGESLKKFKIPSKLRHLWKYIDNAYHTDAFHKSCPPDREILWNWSKTHLSKKDLLQIMLEAPHKTLSIPNEISSK